MQLAKVFHLSKILKAEHVISNNNKPTEYFSETTYPTSNTVGNFCISAYINKILLSVKITMDPKNVITICSSKNRFI